MRMKQVYEYYDRQENQNTSDYVYCPLCQTALTLEKIGNNIRPNCKKCGFVHYQNPFPVVSILITDHERVLLGKRLADPGMGSGHYQAGTLSLKTTSSQQQFWKQKKRRD